MKASAENAPSIVWPHGRRFAFSIIDDTDNATLARVKPFYDALLRHGLRTTKTVWSLPTAPADPFWGESLADDDYRRWLHTLEDAGFEIGWHGARSGGSERAIVERGLERFREIFGAWPRTYANHARNRECIYWGERRFDRAAVRGLYKLTRASRSFRGSLPGDAHYWSDLCAARIRYVRGFAYSSIVTSRVDPYAPFYDARRPDVRAWFSAADAPERASFVRLLAAPNLERLERSGGFCIIYTHVASGFARDGVLDPAVEAVIADVGRRPGWFVPVETLLGHVEAQRGIHAISRRERGALEDRFIADKLRGKIGALARVRT